jgi:NADH-quinone oxidoreductase subunit E
MSHIAHADEGRQPLDISELPKDKVARFDAGLPDIVKRYPEDRKAAAMLPALHLAQHVFGYRLGTSPSRAEEVATFYVMYFTRPAGRHVVEVCTNVACALTGGFDIFQHLKKTLGVENGGTTNDGRITLRQVECLGSCATAPAMLVDEEMYERLTPAEVDRILGGLK